MVPVTQLGAAVTASVELRVYAELNDFVPSAARWAAQLRPIRPHQTVKDIVEAAGIPHTEVDLMLVNGESVDFGHHPRPGDRLAAYPIFETLDIGPLTRVRPRPLRDPRFIVDVNLGGLARLMRLMDSTPDASGMPTTPRSPRPPRPSVGSYSPATTDFSSDAT